MNGSAMESTGHRPSAIDQRPSFARLEYEDYRALAPGVLEGLDAIGLAIKAAGVEERILELAKMRASQLNGCAQCVQIHINASRRLGIPIQKIDMIAVWRESPIYDAEERAVLAWTDLLTDLTHSEITDEAYAAIHEHFTPEQVAALTAAIAHIGVYNRLGNTYKFTPPFASRRET
jgi:AhpD family alkylhydroperoxidase